MKFGEILPVTFLAENLILNILKVTRFLQKLELIKINSENWTYWKKYGKIIFFQLTVAP